MTEIRMKSNGRDYPWIIDEENTDFAIHEYGQCKKYRACRYCREYDVQQELKTLFHSMENIHANFDLFIQRHNLPLQREVERHELVLWNVNNYLNGKEKHHGTTRRKKTHPE